MKKVLIPVTNHATLGETDQANGTYAPELTHALRELQSAGYDYDIASIKGGKAPLYGTDIEGDSVNTEILTDEAFQNRINNTIPVSQININDYDAIFYPGGFGLLSDLSSNEDFAALAATHYEQGGVIAAVCHGPGALLPITLSNGDKLLASKSVTGFTREEEIDFGTIGDIPFLLEESLARTAAQYSKVQPWQEFVIVDERVITGQNPTSAHAVGKAIVAALS
ncbi:MULTISPECIES: type 1 glutamine amidotransferase domain-containing protein [Vibrio]|jgi:putative intracellular protease/amidase|uniref:Type 1 glutamine amidotransferase domain-containing protein n=1 Tax=Vibrio mediterranei TaxID=689 RepID=A0ABX5DDR7_9VIBR|nr:MULTISPECIES: type 1 glutamine amidotransferase domain-containing protein [Vibrio]EDL51486.1 ThiJ/PfpI [Vibrio mediterranei AK1]MCF4172573.1 type 1 glutamine amidotransferase domain-containing protein [Vibrio sp. McD22-P3]MCG9662028.1 type 1 glutamine amidotransferase domain-containing protein [Vibrio mediterranei]MDA0109225.1 type 1 glutamine amidotransferase domain-containing protein [Vibrio sp. La 4.2.2]NOH26712.1 type 1 glutamine amidotransferase domain-containing protein [Vibrio medite